MDKMLLSVYRLDSTSEVVPVMPLISKGNKLFFGPLSVI